MLIEASRSCIALSCVENKKNYIIFPEWQNAVVTSLCHNH